MKTMTGLQYKRALKQIGLSQVKGGHFLGFAPRTSRRIIAGDAVLPLSAAKLLRLMIAQGLTPADVDQLASPSKPAVS